jgi:uncharacterized protein (TIGR02646 family)
MLRYAKGAAPPVLAGWQATPHATWDSLSASDKDQVREAILRDQGCLCAYCQRRIPTSDGRMKVEHWQAQSGGKHMLRWTNLLGVCLGDEAAETGATRGEKHCDTFRGDTPLFLHPVDGQGPSPREHLAYGPEGETKPSRGTTRREAVLGDIQALNMNAARLRRERRIIYEEVKRRLDKAGWTLKAHRDEHKKTQIQPGTRAASQCEVARYYLERWARKHDFQL